MAFTPEQKVVLEAGRVDGFERRARLEGLLRAGIDWDAVRETAARHGVAAHLYARVRKLDGGIVPADEMGRLCSAYAAQARRNLLLAGHLLKVLEAFESRGIRAVPVKGPALAEETCGDVTMRQFADLDILVEKDDIPAVKELLAAHGYARAGTMTDRQERAHLARTCELSYSMPGRGIFLDIHWRLAADYLAPAVDAADVFARQVPGRLQGRPVRALAPDDLLLFLCLHGTFHLWETLGLVCDVARLVESRDDWDWPRIRERAREFRLARMLLLGLWLARKLCGARLPDDVAAEARKDPGVAALTDKVCRALFRPARSGGPGFRETARFQLAARDGLRDRLSYCAIRAFFPTAGDWEFVRLPDRLYFLYFLLRPLRLAGVPSPAASRRSPDA